MHRLEIKDRAHLVLDHGVLGPVLVLVCMCAGTRHCAKKSQSTVLHSDPVSQGSHQAESALHRYFVQMIHSMHYIT